MYIDPAITGTRRNAAIQSFNNWQDARYANNSLVTYTFVSTPPSANEYSHTVLNSPPTVNQGARAETGNTYDTAGNTLQATTWLDPRTGATNDGAVTDVMTHEIGHPMGLDDCACTASESVMAPYAPGNDFWNGLSGRPTSPSDCDNWRLKQSNYTFCSPPVNTEGCTWNSSTCTCDPIYGGGGTYYEYNYNYGGGCTDYYWVHYQSLDGGQTWKVVDSEYAGCLY